MAQPETPLRTKLPWPGILILLGLILAFLAGPARVSSPSGSGLNVTATAYRAELCGGGEGCGPCGPDRCNTDILVLPRGGGALPLDCRQVDADVPHCLARFPNGRRMMASFYSWSPDRRFAVTCDSYTHDSPGCGGLTVWDVQLGVPLWSLRDWDAYSEWAPREPHTLIYIARGHLVARLDPLTREATFLAECPDWLFLPHGLDWCAQLRQPVDIRGTPSASYELREADQPLPTAEPFSRSFTRALSAPDGRRLARLYCHEHPGDAEAHCAGRLASGLRLELAGEPRWSPSGRFAVIRLPHNTRRGKLEHVQVWDFESGRPLELELPVWDTFVWSEASDVLAYVWVSPGGNSVRLLDAPTGTTSEEPTCPAWYEAAPHATAQLKVWCWELAAKPPR